LAWAGCRCAWGVYSGGEQHSNPRKHNLRNLIKLPRHKSYWGVLVRLWTTGTLYAKGPGDTIQVPSQGELCLPNDTAIIEIKVQLKLP
jgi:hypothetical protein